MIRRCLLLALLVAAPGVARAQFATFIPPKTASSDSAAAATATAQRVKRDSSSAVRLANMKAWVDSAAGLPPRATRAADTVLSPRDTFPVLVATARGRTAPAVPAPVTPISSTRIPVRGARAPATASDLPLLLLVGALLLVTGVMLLAGQPSRRRHA